MEVTFKSNDAQLWNLDYFLDSVDQKPKTMDKEDEPNVVNL